MEIGVGKSISGDKFATESNGLATYAQTLLSQTKVAENGVAS